MDVLNSLRTVHVVDDDKDLLRAISRLVRSHGYEVRTYSAAFDFLHAEAGKNLSCLVLDLQLPGLNGLQLQELLKRRNEMLPVIFITGHGSIPASVRAMKAGAVDFLTKPFDESQLISAIETAMLRAEEVQSRDAAATRDRLAFEGLSERERQVCVYVAAGMLNKQIAAAFGTREQTVKAQRGSLMKKLEADSSADIVRLVERLRSTGYLTGLDPVPVSS